MGTVDLVCKECGHAFTITTRGAVKDKQKRCPECRSRAVRQTFASFLRNGSLSSPSCGVTPTGGFG